MTCVSVYLSAGWAGHALHYGCVPSVEHVHTHACMHPRVRTHMYAMHRRTTKGWCVTVAPAACACMHACMCVCVCVCMRARACARVCDVCDRYKYKGWCTIAISTATPTLYKASVRQHVPCSSTSARVRVCMCDIGEMRIPGELPLVKKNKMHTHGTHGTHARTHTYTHIHTHTQERRATKRTSGCFSQASSTSMPRCSRSRLPSSGSLRSLRAHTHTLSLFLSLSLSYSLFLSLSLLLSLARSLCRWI